MIGPDGHPITSAIALGRTYIPNKLTGTPFTFFTGNAPQIKVRDGRFEIPGCDPEKPYTFHFLDREHQLGATVELSGKSARNGPVTIQLEKCGTANVRYKDPQGKPIAGHTGDQLMLIITPGADLNARPDQIMADMLYQSNLDSERFGAPHGCRRPHHLVIAHPWCEIPHSAAMTSTSSAAMTSTSRPRPARQSIFRTSPSLARERRSAILAKLGKPGYAILERGSTCRGTMIHGAGSLRKWHQ